MSGAPGGTRCTPSLERKGVNMLENCVDLRSCEIRLLEALKTSRLLGEIPLSDQDIEILAAMVRGSTMWAAPYFFAATNPAP